MNTFRRTIHPVIRILDEKAGICEYVASDETIDSYNEVIRADGWLFDDFAKNAPFVDCHDYSNIGKCLGKVLDYQVKGGKLIETVQWAIGMGNGTDLLADWGFRMTAAGFLKAVSVGFIPVTYATAWDSNPTQFNECLEQLELGANAKVSCVYLTQQQKELSACVIGANPNALAKAHKAGILNDAALEKISSEQTRTVISTDDPAVVEMARRRATDIRCEKLRQIAAKL
jgi:hypothetical protein